MRLEFKRDYKVINDNLGSGAFGRTKLIYNPEIDQKLVIKKYEPLAGIDKVVFFDYFKSEIKLLHGLLHKNIVRVWDYILYPDLYTGYILMEYIEGMDIGAYAKDYSLMVNIIDINSVFTQLIDAFSYLEEKGVIHRDIRESNILISNTGYVSIIDFGIGKELYNNETSDINEDSLGSLVNRYQMKTLPDEFKTKEYTHKTDMFCIAELIQRLINDNNIVDFKFNKMLKRMQEKKPLERYSSFSEIKNLTNKRQIEDYEFSLVEKGIYRKFANDLDNILIRFTTEQVFRQNQDEVMKKLESVYKLNLLNEYIVKNNNLIKCFTTSGYTYSIKKVSASSLIDFYKLIKELDKPIQKSIIEQIQYRLSLKEVVENKLPF